MKAGNLEVLAGFQQRLDGLTLQGEAEFPYSVSVWEVAECGAFSVETLLLSLGYLTTVDKQNLFQDVEERFSAIEQDEDIAFNRRNCFIYSPEQDRSNGDGSFDREAFVTGELEAESFRATVLERLGDIRQKFQELARVLDGRLNNLQVLRLSTSDLDFQRIYDVYVLVGQTSNGCWMGVSTRIHYRYPEFDIPDAPLYSGRLLVTGQAETAALPVQEVVDVLEPVIQRFTFPPTAPYYFDFEITDPHGSFDGFVWEVADTRSQVVEHLLESISFMQVRALQSDQDFYNLVYMYPNEEGEYEAENFQKTRLLWEHLKSSLSDRTAYRFGLCEIDLYFVGTTAEQDRVCVSSRVVET